MAPSGRVTPHSVGRCRASDRGVRLRSSPAKRVGERAFDLVAAKDTVSPSVSFADSSLTEGASKPRHTVPFPQPHFLKYRPILTSCILNLPASRMGARCQAWMALNCGASQTVPFRRTFWVRSASSTYIK